MNGALATSPTFAAVIFPNPIEGSDHAIASWFHARLTQTSATVLHALSGPGSGEWIGVVLFFATLFFVWKKRWAALATFAFAVPCGMLLNEWLKVIVQRQRPFVEGAFVDWSGYSFASGHTIGATLLYGQIAILVLPMIKSRQWQTFAILAALSLVLGVGFSRIALGAHYLSDVLAAIVLGSLWLAFCGFGGAQIRRSHLRRKGLRSGEISMQAPPAPADAHSLIS